MATNSMLHEELSNFDMSLLTFCKETASLRSQ